MADVNDYRLRLRWWQVVLRALAGVGLTWFWTVLFEIAVLIVMYSLGLFEGAEVRDPLSRRMQISCWVGTICALVSLVVGGIGGPLWLERTPQKGKVVVYSSGVGAYLSALVGGLFGLTYGWMLGIRIFESFNHVWALLAFGVPFGVGGGWLGSYMGSRRRRRNRADQPVLRPFSESISDE